MFSSDWMGNHIETASTVSNLRLVCQTKQSLVSDKSNKMIT